MCNRAMPFGASPVFEPDDEVYAIVAYLLYVNDIMVDDEFELSSNENFADDACCPTKTNFFMDDPRRDGQPRWSAEGRRPA